MNRDGGAGRTFIRRPDGSLVVAVHPLVPVATDGALSRARVAWDAGRAAARLGLDGAAADAFRRGLAVLGGAPRNLDGAMLAMVDEHLRDAS